MDKRKLLLLLFLLQMLMLALAQPISIGEAQDMEANLIEKTFPITATPVDWSTLWSKFKNHVEWRLERNEGAGWVETAGLTIDRVYPEPNLCKITLIFDSVAAADYRLTIGLDVEVLKYTHKTGAFNYTIEYKDYVAVFDWSDLKDINGLTFNHGVLNSTFWWRVRRSNVPEGVHVELDPSWQISQSSDDCRVWEAGASHPPWDSFSLTGGVMCGRSSYGDYMGSGLRFTNVTVEQGITIQSAGLRFTASQDSTLDTAMTRLWGEDVGNSVTFVNASDYNNRNRTSASVQWVIQEKWWKEWWYSSAELKTVVQEIVDRGDWSSGNNMTFFWEDDGSASGRYRVAYSYDNAPAKVAMLHITIGGYSYTFHGLFNEDSGLLESSGVNITAYVPNQAPETFEVNGTTTKTYPYIPQYFSFNLTTNREYWLKPDEYSTHIYVFDTDNTQTYTITFEDLVGVLEGNPFVSSLRYINGTLMEVERRKVDVRKITRMALKLGQTYTIKISGEVEYTFGDIITSEDTTITLTIKAIYFPKETLLTYKNVRIYATRKFGTPNGNITINYQDLLEETNSVAIFIYYRNGTTAFSAVAYTSSFVYTWHSAENDTDYQLMLTIDHEGYGVWMWPQYFPQSMSQAPWGLDFLGDLYFGGVKFDTSVVLPAFLILFVAGCFSVINAETGVFMAVVTAGVLTYMGWIPIPGGFLIAAVSLAILMAMVRGKRGVTA